MLTTILTIFAAWILIKYGMQVLKLIDMAIGKFFCRMMYGDRRQKDNEK